ncbi:unnamed protein product, partial [Dicrocoelium dendriticum]
IWWIFVSECSQASPIGITKTPVDIGTPLAYTLWSDSEQTTSSSLCVSFVGTYQIDGNAVEFTPAYEDDTAVAYESLRKSVCRSTQFTLTAGQEIAYASIRDCRILVQSGPQLEFMNASGKCLATVTCMITFDLLEHSLPLSEIRKIYRSNKHILGLASGFIGTPNVLDCSSWVMTTKPSSFPPSNLSQAHFTEPRETSTKSDIVNSEELSTSAAPGNNLHHGHTIQISDPQVTLTWSSTIPKENGDVGMGFTAQAIEVTVAEQEKSLVSEKHTTHLANAEQMSLISNTTVTPAEAMVPTVAFVSSLILEHAGRDDGLKSFPKMKDESATLSLSSLKGSTTPETTHWAGETSTEKSNITAGSEIPPQISRDQPVSMVEKPDFTETIQMKAQEGGQSIDRDLDDDTRALLQSIAFPNTSGGSVQEGGNEDEIDEIVEDNAERLADGPRVLPDGIASAAKRQISKPKDAITEQVSDSGGE